MQRSIHKSSQSGIGATIALTGALVVAIAFPQVGFGAESLEHRAKISMADARAIALQAHAGKITDEELEKERGGSGLRYSFDIKSHNKTYEVGVDAVTGKVLENTPEGPHPD